MSKTFGLIFCPLLGVAVLSAPMEKAPVDPSELFSLALRWYSCNSHPEVLLAVLSGNHPFEGTYALNFSGSGNWSNGRIVVNQNGGVTGQILATIGSVRYSINGSVQSDGALSANLVGIPATRFGTMTGNLCNGNSPVREVSGSGSWFISMVGSGNWSTQKT